MILRSISKKIHLKINAILFMMISIILMIKCPAPLMQPSGKYLSTGIAQLSNFSNYQTLTITLGAYPKSLATYDVALSMSALKLQFDNTIFALQLDVLSTTSTSFNVGINNTRGPCLKALTINYLARQPTYVDAFYIKFYTSPTYSQNLYVTSGTPPGYQFATFTHGQTLPSCAAMIKKAFLNGFHIVSANSAPNNDFDIMIDTSILNSTHLVFRFSTDYDPYTLNFYQIISVFYCEDVVNANLLSNFIQFQVADSNPSSFNFSNPAGFIRIYNLFMGISIFHVKQPGPNFVEFNSYISNPTLFQITTTNNLVGKWMKFQGILILSWNCSGFPSQPWYDYSVKDCRTNCPATPFIGDPVTGLCVNCTALFSNCQTCSNSSTVKCSLCSTGYGINSNGSCQLCTMYLTGCQSCLLTPNYTCTACISSNYIPINGTCQLNCSISNINCQTCQQLNGTVDCQTCYNNYIQLNSNNCTLNCTIADPNCQNCTGNSTSLQCSSCKTNYMLLITNYTCIINCSIAHSLCSSCQQISGVVDCLTCMTNYTQSSTNNCTLNCSLADSNCQNCTLNSTTVQCTFCINNYILLSNFTCQLDCLIPHYKCQTCILSGIIVQCQSCQINYIIPVGLNTCVLDCNAIMVGCNNCSQNNSTFPSTYICNGCASGFSMSGNGTCIITSTNSSNGTTNVLKLQFQYIAKQSQSNNVFLFFSLFPTDSASISAYKSINWAAAIQTDISFSQQMIIQFIQSPLPHLKIGGLVNQNLQGKDKSVNVTGYNSSIYPVGFSALLSNEIKLVSLKSQNNIALKVYDDNTYTLTKAFSYIGILVVILYLMIFLLGFIAGKIYILECGVVAEITFLSLVFIKSMPPTMTSLINLKYIFGYNYSPQQTSSNFSTQTSFNQAQFTGIKISSYFIYNFNIMMVFLIISLIIYSILKFKQKKPQKQGYIETNIIKCPKDQKRLSMFFLSIPLYFILWFGLWIFTTGQIQIKNITNNLQQSGLKYIGLILFLILFIIYGFYAVIYMKKYQKIQDFSSYFRKNSTSKQQKLLAQYFYIIIFLQKIIISSICANMYQLKIGNIIILIENIIFIIIIILFKPYIYNIKALQLQDSIKKENNSLSSSIKPNIRQIINFSILAIIQILFLITNYFQNNFILYVPIIILILLLINIALTIYFLIVDGVLKYDLINLKSLFMNNQQKQMLKQNLKQQINDTSRNIQVKQIQAQLHKQKQDISIKMKDIKGSLSDKKGSQSANQTNFVPYTPKSQKTQNTPINQLKQKNNQNKKNNEYNSKKNNEYNSKKSKKSQQNNSQQNNSQINSQLKQMQDKLQKQIIAIHQQNIRKHLTVDQMLTLMAQKNHQKQYQISSKNQNSSYLQQSNQESQLKLKKHHQIMKQVKNSKNSNASNSSLISQQWNQLQDIDSARMDKLIKFYQNKAKQT